MPMMEMFDRGIQLRMGQAYVKRWIDDLMPMVADGSDPLGVTSFATHHLPLEQARTDTRSSGTRRTAASRSSSSRRAADGSTCLRSGRPRPAVTQLRELPGLAGLHARHGRPCLFCA
jgi:hypothetical protein